MDRLVSAGLGEPIIGDNTIWIVLTVINRRYAC
jgi:hypothetical protein